MTQMSPNLPPDAGPAVQELTKVHYALCTEKKNEAQRENDLIYNSVLVPAETLPQIDKAVVATPITIQEVYATPEVEAFLKKQVVSTATAGLGFLMAVVGIWGDGAVGYVSETVVNVVEF